MFLRVPVLSLFYTPRSVPSLNVANLKPCTIWNTAFIEVLFEYADEAFTS